MTEGIYQPVFEYYDSPVKIHKPILWLFNPNGTLMFGINLGGWVTNENGFMGKQITFQQAKNAPKFMELK